MSAEPQGDPWSSPAEECDVVMKGGVTSGVIYPQALTEFARNYRLRSLGGTSAGAIGAAFGAAAEYGRESGGFAKLHAAPGELADGRLFDLFQPTRSTRPLFGVMVAGSTKRARRIVGALLSGFWLPATIGALLGIVLVVWGVTARSAVGWGLAVAGLILAVVGMVIGIAVGVLRSLAKDVPANDFGLCTGLSERQDGSAFTEWLGDHIDEFAGKPADGPPLTFGDLWGPGVTADSPVRERAIDLRMISTCVSRSRPYELPLESTTLYYDESEWSRIFPRRVIEHLSRAAATYQPEDADEQWEIESGLAHPQRLLRLPQGADLPVIVATRLSLSFPVLISAVPVWAIDRASAGTRDAEKAHRAGDGTARPEFHRLWFTDGGLCSNFPVHLFDAALPTRPTFAINLGRFDPEEPIHHEFDRQVENVRYATSNSDGLLPSYRRIDPNGIAGVKSFATAALVTMRTWTDSSHLDVPGYRDRLLQVLQTATEGGLNLSMDRTSIDLLAERGRAGAQAMVDQYTQPHYPTRAEKKTATGWDNHRWIRYRSLVAALPDFLGAYERGLKLIDTTKKPPSYAMNGGQPLANELLEHVSAAATTLAGAERSAIRDLERQPKRRGRIRRVPQM